MRCAWALALTLGAAGCGAGVESSRVQPKPRASTCAESSSARIGALLAQGRIARATAAWSELSPECRRELGDLRGELVLALAELGRGEEARALARELASGSTGAMPAAERGLEHLAKYGSSGGDRASMLRAYDRALDAEHEGRHAEARAAYLEAWAHFRPNPQALVRAGRVASRAGDAAGAQRLYDRALSELAKRPRAAAIALDEHQQGTAEVRWLGGERAFSIYQNGVYQLFDSKTLELLTTYRVSSPWAIFSDDGRRLAVLDLGEQPKLRVFHAQSGHTLFSSPLEAHASTLVANADLSLIATTGGDAVEVFEPNAGRRAARFTAKGRARQLRFVGQDILFGAFDDDKLLVAWDLTKGAVLWQRTFDRSPFDLGASSPGDRIAGIAPPDPRSKSKAARAVLLDLRTGELTETSIAWEKAKIDAHEPRSTPKQTPELNEWRATIGASRADSPSGRILYFKTERAVVLRESDGRETVVRTAPAELRGAALVPDASGVVLGEGRGIRSLSFGASKLGWLGARGGPSEQLGFSDDGRWLVASGQRIVVLDTTTGAVRYELPRADSADVRLSAAGDVVGALDYASGVLWHLGTGEVVRHEWGDAPFPAHPNVTVSCCQGLIIGPDVAPYVGEPNSFDGPRALSADGRRIAIGRHAGASADGVETPPSARIYDTDSRALVGEISVGPDSPLMTELVLDRTGRRAVVTDWHFAATLYDVDSKRKVQIGHGRELSFSRDGKLLMGIADDSAHVWRTDTGARLGSFVLSSSHPDSGVFIAEDGRLEWLGKPEGVFLTCRTEDVELPFEACADRLVEPGLLRATLPAR